MFRFLTGFLPKSVRRKYEEQDAARRVREDYRKRRSVAPVSEVEQFVQLQSEPQPVIQPEVLGAAQLVHINDQGQRQSVYPLSEMMQTGRMLIGRGHSHVSIVDDPSLSPRHAVIEIKDGHYSLRDLGSNMGTFLRCQKTILEDLDRILIGWYLFEFQMIRPDLDPRLESFNSLGAADDTPSTPKAADPYDPTSPSMGGGETIQVGSLPMQRQAQLMRILPQGQRGEVYSFNRSIVIGRTEGDVVLSDNSYVSRRHATIQQYQGRFELCDLGSKNGTFVRLRRPVKLQHGECFIAGRQFFRFEMVTPPAANGSAGTEYG
ncbi:FHA domain-containing protein [Leptolyngbya sp. FACHB-261]|uniref:FHA domain-containing protein n=1 Tax=Leptolyngbya sp. FACHB-261 TaxID=2692806 RepID=UPI001682BDB6|nr:FHA domain-containing protein [Leptolyngbya sp. FACHB-261]MBD2102906.1 FHA domain-containing protein [Leptolyngbya sp. FACHB-261]